MPATTTNPARLALAALGKPLVQTLTYTGAISRLAAEAAAWVWRSLVLRRVRLGRIALYAQIVRLGVRSIGVIALVNACVGIILALQLAPQLQGFGQVQMVANIIAVAVVRELGPLLTAVVMTGFAGASVAAELGTMVVAEEVEALRSLALNPTRFLVVPRILATVCALAVLCVIGELVAIACSWAVGVWMLDIPWIVYINNTLEQLKLSDFTTGLTKAAVFGAIIGLFASHNGLAVSGGAAGVGRATTRTVVHSLLAIIFADLLFTSIFYRLGWT